MKAARTPVYLDGLDQDAHPVASLGVRTIKESVTAGVDPVVLSRLTFLQEADHTRRQVIQVILGLAIQLGD